MSGKQHEDCGGHQKASMARRATSRHSLTSHTTRYLQTLSHLTHHALRDRDTAAALAPPTRTTTTSPPPLGDELTTNTRVLWFALYRGRSRGGAHVSGGVSPALLRPGAQPLAVLPQGSVRRRASACSASATAAAVAGAPSLSLRSHGRPRGPRRRRHRLVVHPPPRTTQSREQRRR